MLRLLSRPAARFGVNLRVGRLRTAGRTAAKVSVAEVHTRAADLKGVLTASNYRHLRRRKLVHVGVQVLLSDAGGRGSRNFDVPKRQITAICSCFARSGGVPAMRLMEFLESIEKAVGNEINRRRGYCRFLVVAIRHDIEFPRQPIIIFKKFVHRLIAL
jgi:hypothetical protein